jgi:hypothetical protein
MARVGAMDSTENGSDQSAANRVWYRCSRCHHNILFDEDALATLQEPLEIKAISKEQCTEYSPEKSFSVGDAIYHSAWDDMGWVKTRDKTSDGCYAITVEFQKLGERKLIDSFHVDDSTEPIE